jgi:hypothetical protein
MFMEEKKQVNFSMPLSVYTRFRELAEPHGVKQQWSVITAAIISLLECEPEYRKELIGEVLSSDTKNENPRLMTMAEEGELHRTLSERIAHYDKLGKLKRPDRPEARSAPSRSR